MRDLKTFKLRLIAEDRTLSTFVRDAAVTELAIRDDEDRYHDAASAAPGAARWLSCGAAYLIEELAA